MDGKLDQIRLIVGLGNPGSRYENTYHNVGVDLVEVLAGELEWETPEKLFDTATLPSGDKKRRYLIPNTFMNESGEAVLKAVKKYRLQPKEVLIVHDDSDLQIGSFKVSLGRGSAGHRGVQSIIHQLQTKDFARLRIGVRSRIGKASDFVLKKVSPQDKKELQRVFGEIKETVIEKAWLPD